MYMHICNIFKRFYKLSRRACISALNAALYSNVLFEARSRSCERSKLLDLRSLRGGLDVASAYNLLADLVLPPL